MKRALYTLIKGAAVGAAGTVRTAVSRIAGILPRPAVCLLTALAVLAPFFAESAAAPAVTPDTPAAAAVSPRHILEIEGAKSFTDLHPDIQKLIKDGDDVELIFRGENASLTIDRQGKNLHSLTIAGNGTLKTAKDTTTGNPATFTVSEFHRDETCRDLTVDIHVLETLRGSGANRNEVTLGAGYTLTIEADADHEFTGTFAMAPGSEFRKTGAGTLTLSGSQNVYGGLLRVMQGGLVVRSTNPNRFGDGLIVDSGAVFTDAGAKGASKKGKPAQNQGAPATIPATARMAVYGTLNMGKSVWTMPAETLTDAQGVYTAPRVLTLYAGCRVNTDKRTAGEGKEAFYWAGTAAGGLSVRKNGTQGGDLLLPAILSALNTTLTVDVEDGIRLALPPPSVKSGSVGTVNLVKAGAGRWYCRNGASKASEVSFAHTGTTTIAGGSLYVYGTMNSRTTVKAGGCIGGSATVGGPADLGNVSEQKFQEYGRFLEFESGAGVDWRSWDPKQTERLKFGTFYSKDVLLGWFDITRGYFPFVAQGGDFVVIDRVIPTDMKLFGGNINFDRDPSRQNFDSQKLTFVTDAVTYRDNYYFTSQGNVFDRTILMTATDIGNTQVLATTVEVPAKTARKYTSVDSAVRPLVNGVLTLNYLPYTAEQGAGTFVFDEPTMPALRRVELKGMPGTVDASGDTKVVYTELKADADFAVTADFLNRIGNTPQVFNIPAGRTVTLRGGGAATRLVCPIEGDDWLHLTDRVLMAAPSGPLVNVRLKAGSELSFERSAGAFYGAAIAESGAVLKTRQAEPTAVPPAAQPVPPANFCGMLILTSGTVLDATGAGQTVTALKQVVLPQELTVRADTFPGSDGALDLLQLQPSAELAGVPPESVTVRCEGAAESARYALFLSETNCLQLKAVDLSVTSVTRTLTESALWYDHAGQWINDDSQARRKTFNLPPRGVNVTVKGASLLAGLAVNTDAEIGTLRLTAQDAETPSGIVLSALANGEDGRNCTLTANGDVTVDTDVMVKQDMLRFAADTLKLSVTANGMLNGCVRVPNLEFAEGARLFVGGDGVPTVTHHLKLPNKWSVRLSTGSFGDTKILSVLPTASIEGWTLDDEKSQQNRVELWTVGGVPLTENERAMCRVCRRTDGFYVVKELPSDAIQLVRTLTAPKDGKFAWKSAGAWVNPADRSKTYDVPPSDAFVTLTLDARGAAVPPVMTLTTDAAVPVRGLIVRSLGGTPVLRVKAGADGTQLTAGETHFECGGAAGGFTVRAVPGAVNLKKFQMDAHTVLELAEDAGAPGSAIEPVTDIAFNRGVLTFGHPGKTLKYTAVRRSGHVHVTGGTVLELKKPAVPDNSGVQSPIYEDMQIITNMQVTGDGAVGPDASVLKLPAGETVFSSNAFPVEDVRVCLAPSAVNPDRPVAFGLGVYLGERALLQADCRAEWGLAENTAGGGRRSVIAVGGLQGGADLSLAMAEKLEIHPLSDSVYSGSLSDRPFAAGLAGPDDRPFLGVRILPQTQTAQPAASGPAEAAQIFSGRTEQPLPLTAEGGRFLLTGDGAYWAGSLSVSRYTDTATAAVVPGEAGGNGRVGGDVSFDAGTMLNLTAGPLTLGGALVLPDAPLYVRVPASAGDVSRPVKAFVVERGAASVAVPAGLRLIALREDGSEIGGAYRFVADTDGRTVLMEKIIAHGILNGGEMTWAPDPDRPGEAVDWRDSNGNPLTLPLPDDIDVELSVEDRTKLDINNTGTAHLNSLTVDGVTGNNSLTFIDSVLGADKLAIDRIQIGSDPNKPAHVVVESGIGQLGNISIAEGSSLTVQENLENVGTLTDDNPGTLVFMNPKQDGKPGNNPPFVYKDEGKVAHVIVAGDTDLTVSFAATKTKTATPDIRTYGKLLVSASADKPWNGDILVALPPNPVVTVPAVSDAAAHEETMGPGSLAGAGTISGAVTMNAGTVLHANPYETEKREEKNNLGVGTHEVTVDVSQALAVTGPLTLPTELVVQLPPKDPNREFPIRLFKRNGTPPATSLTVLKDDGTLAGSYALKPEEQDGVGFWVARSLGNVFTRTVKAEDKHKQWYVDKGWQQGFGKADEPDADSTAEIIVEDSVSLEMNSKNGAQLGKFIVRRPAHGAAKNPHLTIGSLVSGKGKAISAKTALIAAPLTIQSDSKATLGDVVVQADGVLKLAAAGTKVAMQSVNKVTVSPGGTLWGNASVTDLILENGAVLDISDGHPLKVTGSLTTYPSDVFGSLTVKVPADIAHETYVLNQSATVARAAANSETLRPGRIKFVDPQGKLLPLLIESWDAKGLKVLRYDRALTQLTQPNRWASALDHTKAYTEDAALKIRQMTHDVFPKIINAVTSVPALSVMAAGEAIPGKPLTAEQASAAIECFDRVMDWDAQTKVLTVAYEFGITRSTYVSADTLCVSFAAAAPVNAVPGASVTFRPGTAVALFGDIGRGPVEIKRLEQTAAAGLPPSAGDIRVTEKEITAKLHGAFSPGTTLKLSVRAVRPTAQ